MKERLLLRADRLGDHPGRLAEGIIPLQTPTTGSSSGYRRSRSGEDPKHGSRFEGQRGDARVYEDKVR